MSTRLEQLLLELVRIPSPSGDEAAAADFAAAALGQPGVEVQRIGNSVFAKRCGARPGAALFLNSHLDTVPAGDGWLADPWDVDWADGRLTGLGANDAKSSAAAMLWAFLEADASALEGELWLGLTACEETSNAGMTELLAALPRLPDAAVTGEPTGLEVVRAQSGLAVIEAHWHGKACHAAHVLRVDHVNALMLAAEDLARVAGGEALEGEHPLLGRSTLVPTVLRAGKRHNVVPDAAYAEFDARLAPPHDAAECVARLQAAMPNAELRIRSERLRPVETAADHPLVQAALRCTGKAEAIGSSTMSDMALLAGIPAIKCGPGETRRSHTANEYVTQSELAAAGRAYSELIPRVLSSLSAAEATHS